MIDLQELQRKIYQNKVDKKFNTTDVHAEFDNITKEITEAKEAYESDPTHLGEELADIIIFTIGIAAIANIDIEQELLHKVDINAGRTYIVNAGRYIKQ